MTRTGDGQHGAGHELVLVGYWTGPETPGLPDPRDYVDPFWDADERDVVADYLGRGFLVWGCMGYSTCRFCGCKNGCLELSDGTYVWPDGLAHYVLRHDLRPPAPLVDHILERVAHLEAARYDSTWWRSLAHRR